MHELWREPFLFKNLIFLFTVLLIMVSCEHNFKIIPSPVYPLYYSLKTFYLLPLLSYFPETRGSWPEMPGKAKQKWVGSRPGWMPGDPQESIFNPYTGQLSFSTLRYSHIFPINSFYYLNSLFLLLPTKTTQLREWTYMYSRHVYKILGTFVWHHDSGHMPQLSLYLYKKTYEFHK